MTIARLRPVVSAKWLSDTLARLKNPREVRVLDCSFKIDPSFDSYTESYKPKHIPGSKFFNIHHCVERTKYIPRNLPDLKCLEDYVQSLGIWKDTHVITYDREDSRAACRVWWIFRAHGHDKVSILDGGLKKWEADGRETSSEEPEVEKSDFKPVFNPNLLRNFDIMLRNVETKEEAVLDSRPADAFVGNKEESQSGHIPGSKSLPFPRLFNEDGTFRSDTELKRLYSEVGIDLNKPLVATCLFGMTACALVATCEILGKPDVPMYYGSWTEWSQRVGPELCIKGDN